MKPRTFKEMTEKNQTWLKDALLSLKKIFINAPYDFVWNKEHLDDIYVGTRLATKVINIDGEDLHFNIILEALPSITEYEFTVNITVPEMYGTYYPEKHDSIIKKILEGNTSSPWTFHLLPINIKKPYQKGKLDDASRGDISFYLEPEYVLLSFYNSVKGTKAEKMIQSMEFYFNKYQKGEGSSRETERYISQLKINYMKPEDITIEDWVDTL